MSSFRLKAPPCCDCASRSSLASRWAIVFSRRWRAEPTRPRGGGGGGGGGGRPPRGHRLLAPLAGEAHEPADGEGAGAARGHLDGDLVGRTADAAGADLENRRQRLDRLLERLHRVLARALTEDRQRVVHDALGGRLL